MNTLQIGGEVMKTLEQANDLVAQLVAENTKLRQDAAKLSDDLEEQKTIAGNWKFRASTALTRLAEFAKQEPVGIVDEGNKSLFVNLETADGVMVKFGDKVFAAAGASPQPDADPNAPWLSDAHCLCADQGIPPGHITDRIRALRDKLEQPSQAGELSELEAINLLRFNETCEDGQEYDVRPSMMSRLAEIGVVSRKFGSVYFLTQYGRRVIAAINAKEQS